MALQTSFLNTAVPSAVLADPVQLFAQALVPLLATVTPLFLSLIHI